MIANELISNISTAATKQFRLHPLCSRLSNKLHASLAVRLYIRKNVMFVRLRLKIDLLVALALGNVDTNCFFLRFFFSSYECVRDRQTHSCLGFILDLSLEDCFPDFDLGLVKSWLRS